MKKSKMFPFVKITLYISALMIIAWLGCMSVEGILNWKLIDWEYKFFYLPLTILGTIVIIYLIIRSTINARKNAKENKNVTEELHSPSIKDSIILIIIAVVMIAGAGIFWYFGLIGNATIIAKVKTSTICGAIVFFNISLILNCFCGKRVKR